MYATIRKSNAGNNPIGARATLEAGFERIYTGIPRGRGWATYPFNALTLGSHFQAIFSVAEQRCVAYEGLLCASNLAGQPIKPETVFALSASHDEELFLDWLCRALHLRNFANLAEGGGMIFLNAYPEAAIEDPHHPQVFAQMIEYYGVSPKNVVVEILETGVSDEAQLIDAARLYRKLGCKIAIDDFGIGYSNFDRLWRLRPDFVKIDRSVTVSAVTETHARLVLANMVKLIHECGAKVIIEGIETRDEALTALQVGADFLQGYYFARPGLTSVPQALCDRMFEGLQHERPARIGAASGGNENLEIYAHALNLAILDLQRGVSFATATESFRALPNVLRVYLATNDTDAANRGDRSRLVLDLIGNTTSRALKNTPGTAMDQLQEVVQHALAAPLKVHVIAPQQRAIAASGYVTLSCAFEHDRRMVVLCGDLIDRRSPPSESSPHDNDAGMRGERSAAVIQLHL